MAECERSFMRRLYGWEIDQARQVFGNELAYEAVRIYECNSWPNRIDRLGHTMKARFAAVPPPTKSDTAITLGNRVLFPIRLPEFRPDPGQPEHVLFCWLMHELTHVWQYQTTGWGYLFRAIQAQMKEGYTYGGAEKLREFRLSGKTFLDFNLEQQGDIVRDYYRRLCSAEDVTDWEAYIRVDIQRQV